MVSTEEHKMPAYLY